jgi:hypothetical protein
MEEESIPNRGISHAPPGYAASHITPSTRIRFENSTGITKTALEKGQKTTTQCSEKPAKRSKKGHCFSPFLTESQPHHPQIHHHRHTHLPPRPERPASARGQHHAEGTHTIRALLQPRACERRATHGQRKKHHPIISHNVVARDAPRL